MLPRIHQTPYVDNSKVIKYQDKLAHNKRPKMAYMDDNDLVELHGIYNKNLQSRGITIIPATHIQCGKGTTPETTLVHDLHTEMDHQACKTRTENHFTYYIPISPQRIHLVNIDGAITGTEQQILMSNWTTYHLEQYYAHRWETTIQQLQNYDWQTYVTIHANMPVSIQKYMVKLMTGWLPVYHHTNKMMTAKQLCPLCQNEETIAHLFQCHHRQHWRQQLVKTL